MWILRSPDRYWTVALLLAGSAAAHAADDDPKAGRERIARDRQHVEAAYREQAAQCNQQFVVTSCLDQAKQHRREALERLNRELGVLEDAERKQRAAEHAQRVQEKLRAAAERGPEPAPRVVQRPLPASAPASSPSARAPGLPSHSPRPTANEQAEHEAVYQRRQEQAAEHREAVEKRNAAKASGHKPVAALPLPSASAAASGASR